MLSTSMSEEEQQWALIDGQWKSSTTGCLPWSTVEGSFLDVLTSPPARPLLAPFAQAISSSLPLHIVSLPVTQGEGSALDSLAVAVASLHAFVQLNWTGPDLPEELEHPITLLRRAVPDVLPTRSVESDDVDEQLNAVLQRTSLDELTWNGEPAYHLCRSAFLLLFALRILDSLPDTLVTLAWWKLRAASIHSRILDSPMLPSDAIVTSLFQIDARLRELLADGDSEEGRAAQWGSLLARLCVDRGLALQRCGNDREANELFMEAAAVIKLRYEVTGALGRKTKFQREEKTILVLLAESSLSDGKGAQEANESQDEADEASEAYDEAPTALTPNASGWKEGPSAHQTAGMPSVMNHNDDTLLEQTRFSSTTASLGSLSHVDAANPMPLHPLDSAILLALSLNIDNTSPEHGLTSSQISAFVSRVLAHARNWSVHTMGLLLRSRLEANRTRTAQRSVLQLQALLDQMPTSDSTVRERLLYFHELELPSTWEMQAELARRYAALGVIRSALEIFEQVEMWEEAVQCWGAMGRQDRGIEVLQDLLSGRKVESSQVIWTKKKRSNAEVTQTLNRAREAKLWCLLGDLEVDKAEEHYGKAWTVSKQRSARAARSIAGLAFARNDFQQTVLWLKRALKVNPLYSRSWFILGCAYMRLDTVQGYQEASRCFRRCTSLDDDDAESWNNLASCYLRLCEQSQGVLRDAQLAEAGGSMRDATEVLSGSQDGEETDSDSVHSRDSGVAVDSSDTEGEDEGGADWAPGGSSTFDVKMLAHRALTKSLRFSHDDWRVWNNYMIVSVDCGLMGEAVRAMGRVVELRTARASSSGAAVTNAGEFVDLAVLNRLVDAVTRAPSREEDAISGGQDTQGGEVNHSPHEGHGLYPSLASLLETTILPRISSSPAIHRAHARLLFWRRLYRSALEAHLSAWRVSYGSDANVKVTTDKATFVDAVEQLCELSEILENLGDRQIEVDAEGHECHGKAERVEVAMANWRFRARSLVRSFLGRTKDSFEGEPEWDGLIDLRNSLTSG